MKQGTTTEFIANPDKDETVVVHTERFDGLVDMVKALSNEGFHGTKEMRHVAEIPGIIIEQYCFQTGVSWAEFFADPKHIKAICNDPAFAYLRVAPGRV
jgi:hypothetical protein